VLCVPLFHKGNSNGVLYLENNLATAAFSPARVELLQVILGQAAISLDNATLYEGLEEKVEERTKELQAQYLKLKETQSQLIQSEKMASLGTLVAGVAHEINNPANFTYNGAQNAQGRLHQLRDLIFELIGEEADSEVIGMFNEHFDPLFANLTAIVDGTQRIRSIVTGLRTFSRLDEAEYKQEQLVEGIKSTIALVGANYGDDVAFVCEFEADPELECWPAQLNQVFMNLTVNACHAMTARFRKEATEEKQPGKLIIRTMMKDPDTLSISFQDNGVGMPEAVKQRIFEPFFTTKDVGQGTGLGLSISHGIIEKHHGQFLVESTPNVGTTITILLPITQPEESAPAA
jgi:signal transduction histidine kinase